MIPVCPKCKKKIERLSFTASQDCGGTAYLDGNIFQHSTNDVSGSRDGQYFCPECYHLLTEDRGKAEAFLKGKIDLADPKCPRCKERIDGIHTSKSINLIFRKGKWERIVFEGWDIFVCSECGSELTPKELDTLGVPNELR